jgi:hypothetical protein
VSTYEGPVCYADGWHLSVDEDGNPGDRLFLDDDGTYRLAEDGDESWHDRKHGQFVQVELEDGQTQSVSRADWEAFLASRSEG